MTPRQRSVTALLAAALAVSGCGSPADPRGQSLGAGRPLLATVDSLQPHLGHTPDATPDAWPDPDGSARSPDPEPTGGHTGTPAPTEPVDANPDPASDDDTVRPGERNPDLPPPGERNAARIDHTDGVAPTSQRDGPRAASVDIIKTGLAAEGLEVHAVTADLIEQSDAGATVRVTALHRLNGPPRQTMYELELEHDAGTWTVVAHRPIRP